MSGILAVIGDVCDQRVRDALIPLRYLGGEVEQAWREGDVRLVATRKSWQLDDDFCGDVLVLESEDLVVVADASLFDKQGLARRLSADGAVPRGDTPSHLIEAAYRAWGPDLVRHLDGDYAFVIWDRAHRVLFAARDPMGSRPVFWCRVGAGIAVASSCMALAELRGTSGDLNLANLGGQVAGLAWSNGGDTAYVGVDPLLPGRRLTWLDGRGQPEAFWRPRTEPDRRPVSLEAAAEELRDLLGTAVHQRLSSRVTSVWMSGGYDSTAVFAAGQDRLAEGERSRLRPVSISYPVGDPGREDEFIQAVADRWGAAVEWVRSADLGLVGALSERAGRFDEPPAHLYELWNRGLARASRAIGAHVAMDGCGGDQLFQVSDVFLADLLRRGRWIRVAREAHARRARGWRYLARVGVLPLMPRSLVPMAERLTGRRFPRHYLERTGTSWVRSEFHQALRLRERDLDALGTEIGHGHAHQETLLYLSLPVWGWGGGFMRGVLLEEGVEVRSPLLAPRVVEFALGRPIAERSNGSETKRLLRLAMRDLVPDEVLAPRAIRTGVTVGFSRQQMRADYPELLAGLFGAPLRLAELGIADPVALRAAADRFLAGDQDDFLRVNLFHTMKVEFWLRGRDCRVASATLPSFTSPAA